MKTFFLICVYIGGTAIGYAIGAAHSKRTAVRHVKYFNLVSSEAGTYCFFDSSGNLAYVLEPDSIGIRKFQNHWQQYGTAK